MRYRFPLLPTLSLCCCLSLCGLCARSYWRGDYGGYSRTNGPGVVVESARGVLAVTVGRRFDGPGGWNWQAYPEEGTGEYEGAGCFGDGRSACVWFPLWVPVMFMAVPPAWWWVRRVRRRGAGFPVGVVKDEGGGEAIASK